MANLPKEFEGDAFISYAHLDNLELVEGHKGWVANFHRALEVRVGQLLGKSPHIWRDPKLSGNDLFETTLVEKLKHVAVLVTVVSPRYIKSEWTLRELREFMAAAEAQGGLNIAGKARIFKVLKTPVPLDKMPAELKMVLGYEFFKVEAETGKVRELDEIFGVDAQREFWTRLDDLAHDLVALLEAIDSGDAELSTPATAAVPAAPSPPIGTKGVVYLAETTSDLREQADRLRRDLQQHGYTVLPSAPLSFVAEEAVAAIRDSLAKSRMSVHLIGRNYGLVPEGGTVSMVELQHELAAERAAGAEFQRLAWVPDGQQVSDERQLKVIERIAMDPRGGSRADFLETMFEDLRTAVMDRLARPVRVAPQPAPPSPGAATPVPLLYLIADQRDAEAIQPWADALFDQGIEVMRPLFDGDESEIREYHEENLRECDGVLIFYGSANELWLQRKLRELQKAPGYGRSKPRPIAGVCLIGARTPEKERFRTHDAVVAAQWDGVQLGSLAPLLTRLKAGGPV